jgi:hypothetical protein
MWSLLGVAVGLAALAYYFTRPVPLRYPVPSIWQHPDAVPGAWDRVAVFYCSEGKYRGGAFREGRDYVMDPNRYLSARQVNRALDECVADGYRQLDLQKYKHHYGLQTVVGD